MHTRRLMSSMILIAILALTLSPVRSLVVAKTSASVSEFAYSQTDQEIISTMTGIDASSVMQPDPITRLPGIRFVSDLSRNALLTLKPTNAVSVVPDDFANQDYPDTLLLYSNDWYGDKLREAARKMELSLTSDQLAALESAAVSHAVNTRLLLTIAKLKEAPTQYNTMESWLKWLYVETSRVRAALGPFSAGDTPNILFQEGSAAYLDPRAADSAVWYLITSLGAGQTLAQTRGSLQKFQDLYTRIFADPTIDEATAPNSPFLYKPYNVALNGRGYYDHTYPSIDTGTNESPPFPNVLGMLDYLGRTDTNYDAHDADDFWMPYGSDVLAPTGGSVVWNDSQGILIRTGAYDIVLYHLSQINVYSGGVTTGQVVGKSGTAGGVAHLHFEVRHNGKQTDTMGWYGDGSDPCLSSPNPIGSYRGCEASVWLWADEAAPGSTPPSAEYTFCVLEGQLCSFSGIRDIAYGANGSYYYQYGIVGGIDCKNATFGDPIPGVIKACYTRLSPDTTPPSISITQQPATGVWYNTDQTIAFTISDAGSGVRGYKLAWDQNPPNPPGGEIAGASGSVNLSSAGQGPHTLYIQAWDIAGNPSFPVSAVGWLGYDTVAPTYPTSIDAGCTATSGVWQNTCTDANFTWSGASDATSDVAGYEVYWGTDPNGTGVLWSTTAAYNPPAIGNGTYYLRVRTKDNASNWSAWATLFVLQYDGTAPTVSITQQPATGVWYNADQTIAFLVGDTGGSSLRGYKLAWDQNPPGGSEVAASSGSINLSSAGQGHHTLYIQAWDIAGNPSVVQPVGWLGYDTAAPTAPTSTSPGCTGASSTWQNTCADANFTWSGASDATSDVAGYEVYWGTDPNGTGVLWSTTAAYNPSAVSNGTYYLRVRTKDNASNWSAWATLFVLRYDGSAPTGSLQINSNASTTHATLVKLQATASDAPSGLCQMRLRDAGGTWTAWQGYTTSAYWQLPGPTGQTFSVETQYQDCAGNSSVTYADAIALNIYPARPASANYRVVKSTIGASGQSGTSTNYRLNATLGQPSMIGQMTSANYGLASGYWALRPLATIIVTPNPITVTVGATQTLTASGLDAFGNALPVNPAWTTDAGTLTGNVLTAQTVPATGRHVTATMGSINGIVSVNIISGSLNHVAVTPRPVTITVGATQAFTAVGADAFGNAVPITPSWSTDAGVMTDGDLTAQTLPANGKHVTATVGNLSDVITFSVVAGSVNQLTLAPTVVTLTVGATQQFTAVGFDVYNNVISQPALVWQVAPTDVGVIDATGRFTAGYQAGAYLNAITVASGGHSTTATVVVYWPHQVYLPVVVR